MLLVWKRLYRWGGGGGGGGEMLGEGPGGGGAIEGQKELDQ